MKNNFVYYNRYNNILRFENFEDYRECSINPSNIPYYNLVKIIKSAGRTAQPRYCDNLIRRVKCLMSETFLSKKYSSLFCLWEFRARNMNQWYVLYTYSASIFHPPIKNVAKREESKDIAYECTIKNRMFAYARARGKNVQGRERERERERERKKWGTIRVRTRTRVTVAQQRER